MHAKIENGKIVKYPIYDIRAEFPNTSLPADLQNNTSLPEGYVYVEEGTLPANDGTMQIVEVTPVFSDDRWIKTYTLVEFPSNIKASIIESMAASVRMDRDARLTATDWTQAKDISDEISLKWVDYRQALRDVTLQDGFPFNVTWPDLPV